MREQAFGHVQQLGHAHAAARGCEAHRNQAPFAQAPLEGIVQPLTGPGALEWLTKARKQLRISGKR